MSGPALKKADSHLSIHEAALGEAEQLTELLRVCLARGEPDKAYETACITLEHWETRTLAHAYEEEEGLYKEIAQREPAWEKAIISLTRDHVLMRELAEEIRIMLSAGGATREVLTRFEAMMAIDQIHNREELLLITKLGGTL